MISGVAAAIGALARSTSGPLPGGAHGGAGRTAALQPGNAVETSPTSLDPRLLERALAALDRHAQAVPLRDRIAIVDFSAPSAQPRFHFFDVASGEVSRLLVTHGTGSDPHHTGFLQSFSNVFDSNASSEGAFLTGDYYVGKHGRSQRLAGLDPTNDNALDRAIVIHAAWYANADMIPTHGKLGRSQGCFAVGEKDLDRVFGYLGEGRLLYAARAWPSSGGGGGRICSRALRGLPHARHCKGSSMTWQSRSYASPARHLLLASAMAAGLLLAGCSGGEESAGKAGTDHGTMAPALPGSPEESANSSQTEPSSEPVGKTGDTGTIGGDGSAIRLNTLSGAEIEQAGLPGELGCSFATAPPAAPLLIAMGDAASRDPAQGIVKVASSVERIAAPGGFDAMLKGASFSGAGKTVRIALTGPVVRGGESPPQPATLTYERADGASRTIPGLWTCGP